ncbi:HipA family kinase [Frateuria sp. GZRR35]|uniref:HipA family kinase n=1 Tax=Frateuria sp. GZRR35 TaxID=3351536 RepID=UPI003EDC796A
MMLETVDGIRYDDDARGGATLPSMMGCLRDDGQPVDVFVKCSWQQCPAGGLAREVVGCLLAQRLGLVVGQPVLVRLPEELTSTVRQVAPQAAYRMQQSVKPAFGSVALGSGFLRCDGVDPSNNLLRQAATEIWAFDQLILNVDRNARKPNCLVKGDVLAIIDHEKALLVAGVGGFLAPAPWQRNWKSDDKHLFHTAAIEGTRDLDRLHKRWRDIGPEEIRKIISNVPLSWGVSEVTAEMSGYLVDLHQNLDAAFDNLQRMAA